MKQPIKMTPGDDIHLSLLMAPFSLNLVTGQDRQHLLSYGRTAFKAGHALLRASTPEAIEELIEEIIERIGDHAVKVISHHEARKQGDPEQIESARQAVFQADDWIKRDLRILAVRAAPSSQYLHQIQEPTEYPYLPSSTAEVVDFMNGRLEVDFGDPAPAGGTSLYSADQMRAYVDADRAQRTAPVQAAPAAAPVLPEPDAMEFQGNDGEWHGFVDARHKQATVESGKWPIRNLYSEGSVRALLATATGLPAQAAEQAPVLYVSKEQLDHHRDPDGPDSLNAGRYLPSRITPAGKFTTPLFAVPQAQAGALDAELLAFLQDQCIDLRCFTTSDGEDVGWRTVQHHMSEPRERVVSEIYGDQPRRAIRAAMARIERDPYCTGPLHLEDDAAIAAAKGE
ncbi:hypothetical protein [Comamonas sp. lk]|uniref:hypothetical protein n=1 Tax=Comamonas sp. lk TaxID=2201272 RepID=UPI000EAE23CD|nr:hypothetical protein [Comamonas sp. lk]